MTNGTENTHVLRGLEHAAMERLIRANEICVGAEAYLDATADRGRPSSQRNAVTLMLALGPATSKLGAALVAAATNRPGGSAQLSRASRDIERVLRELPPFPNAHRTDSAEVLRELLREAALDFHDIDLTYGVNEAGDHVFTWREESQHAADMMLLEGLMVKMDLMLMSDQRLGFEHAAAVWWYNQSAIHWPSEVEAGLCGWRLREWALADRVIPSLGTTAVEAVPHHELWTSLSARQRSLVRAFATSIPGLFIERGATASGVLVEDVFDGRRHEVVLADADAPRPDHALVLGRLVPRDRGVYVVSPGTAVFGLNEGPPDALSSLLREHASRQDRGQYAEVTMGRLLRASPIGDRAPDLTPADAAEMLAAYERAGTAARVGKTFKVPGAKAQPPDDALLAWTLRVRELAAESSV